MEYSNIEAYVKYNYFHAEQKKKFRENAFTPENLYYNATDDYFVCPKHLEKTGNKTTTNASGHRSEITVYQAANCKDCPLRECVSKQKEPAA